MFKDILLPVDITEENSWKKALDIALEYHEKFNSRIHVMTVVSDYGMSIVQQYFPKGSVERVVDQTRAALRDFVKAHFPSDVQVQHIVAKGAVYECIIQTADHIDADLIIMTAHRPELKDYLLGPNAAKVVRHSRRSVLVVRD